MNDPEYLSANPVSNSFLEIPYRTSYEMKLNLFNEIIYVKTIRPIKTYHKIKDKTEPKDYGFKLR